MTGSKTKKWCMLNPLPNSSTLKTAAVPAEWFLPGTHSQASGASQHDAHKNTKRHSVGLQKWMQQQKDAVASHYIIGLRQIAKIQVKKTILVIMRSIVFIGEIGL